MTHRIPRIFYYMAAIRRRGGGYWTPQRIAATFLYDSGEDATDILNKVVGGQLPNKVTGATDFLTVTGTGLNARYRTPDTDAYRAADTDYCFWKTDASESTCDGNRLVGYDFPRIIVKYLNVAPYTILRISILKAGVTLTAAESNHLRDTFDLSVWWDNTLSAHGATKQNRGIGQSVWTPESVYDARSITLFAQMVALSEPPTDGRKGVIDTAIKALKAANLFDTRFDRFMVYRSHGTASAKLNWIQNTFNAEEVSDGDVLTFTIDGGYTNVARLAHLRNHYIPSSDGTKMTQDNCSYGFLCSGTIGAGTFGSGAWDGTQGLDFVKSDAAAYNRVNGGSYGGIVFEVGYNNLSRSLATEFDQDVITGRTNVVAKNSSALPTTEMFSLATNWNGTPDYASPTDLRWEVEWEGASISHAEFQTIITIMNAYIAAL